jgi:ParB/RepB/Spo0J family partition protein
VAYAEVPIGHVAPLGLNHRAHFDPDRLAELAADIKVRGILQPLIVRPAAEDAPVRWELIAGERRWRAAKMAGLETVPVIVRNESDEDARAIAIVENIQRVDIDPIEEARGYKALSEMGVKQGKIAEMVHRSQPAVANTLRLLDLPEDVQKRIQERELSASHGIVLARWAEFPPLCSLAAKKAADKRLSCHDLEKSFLRRYAYDLTPALEIIGYQAKFDVAVCQQCPYQAYRSEGHMNLCLKPDHYRELQKAAIQAEAEKQRETVAARLKDADPEVTPERIEEAVRQVRHIQDVKNYYRIADTAPTGCTGECPCRDSALGYGGELITICTDPKRYKELQNAQREWEKQAREKPALELLAEASETLDLSGIYQREAALLASLCFADMSDEAIHTEFAAAGIVVPEGLDFEWNPETWDFLAQYSPGQLLKATLRAIFRDEARQATAWSGGNQNTTLWYLGRLKPEAEEAEDDETVLDLFGPEDTAETPAFLGARTPGLLPVIPVDPARLQVGRFTVEGEEIAVGDIALAYSYETLSDPYRAIEKRIIELPFSVGIGTKDQKFYATTYLSDTEAVGWEVVEHKKYQGEPRGPGNVNEIKPQEGLFEGLTVKVPGHKEKTHILTRPVRFVAAEGGAE